MSLAQKVRADMIKARGLTRNMMHQVTRNVLLEMGARLVMRSPVGDPDTWSPAYWPKGYLPGLFINNWQIGINTLPTGVFNNPDPMGANSLERLQKLGRWPAFQTYFFVNNLPYAKALEYGWSPQCPPRGMVGLLKSEYQSIVRNAVAEAKAGNVAIKD